MKFSFSLLALATIAISSTQAVEFNHALSAGEITDLPYLAQNGTFSWGPQVRYFSALARGFI